MHDDDAPPTDAPPRPVAVTLVCADLPESLAFYRAVFDALGVRRLAELGDEEEDDAELEAVGFGLDGGSAVWLVAGPDATSGVHLSVPAGSADAVRSAHEAGLGAGGASRRAPRRWTVYATGDFVAQLLDPAGNVLELVAPE